GVIPYQIESSREGLFAALSEFSGSSLKTLDKSYRKNFQSYFSPVDIITDVDKAKALAIKEKFSDSVVVITRPQRYYPNSYQLAHVLGYVKEAKAFYQELKNYGYSPLERVGINGVEQVYDAYLRGAEGGKLIEVDSRGRIMGFLGEQLPQKGKDITLTVDSRIQLAADSALGQQKGALILMDSQDGGILALCSKPYFNPNDFISGKNIQAVFNDPGSPLLNRAYQATFPIGSTFKPIMATAALEEGKITPASSFNCSGEFHLGRAAFRCWTIHGIQNLYEALAHSCNVYFYNLGMILGPEPITDWAGKFGLNSLTGIDLPSEKSGFVPSRQWKQKEIKSVWYPGDTVNFSIGQGYLLASPLAIMRAMNVFANGGYLVRPHLIKEIDSIDSGISTRAYLGISEKNLQAVRQGLREAVLRDDGSAHILQRLNLKFSGKTGTAQNSGKAHGWFTGFFTYQDKTYTICVFIEHGGASYEAVKIAYYFLKSVIENNLL
ncbi:MAG: hypothetical protein KKH25_03985, partial [Candidatus Omnitrophica bacterium]|nr:hypothetical protein [Candidatus Omnitrophota bacterium]